MILSSASEGLPWRPNLHQMLTLLFLGLLYYGLVQKYRAYDVDNPWFLSFSYNACHGDIGTDTFQEMHYPDGMDGVHLFGKVPAAIQCTVMDRTGWTAETVAGINIVFTLVALWLWWSLLRGLGYRQSWIAAFVLFLGVMEPVVSMVEKARYEFIVFFLFSFALWLAFRGFEFMSVLAIAPVMEVEPAAVITVLLLSLVLLMRTKNWRRTVLSCSIAAAAGIAFYLVLHPGAIYEISHTPPAKISYTLGSTMRVYFIDRHRHLPELAMFLVAAWLCWQQRKAAVSADRAGQWLALAAAALLLVLPHPNPSYIVFGIPFFLWAALAAYDRADRWQWVPALVFLGLLAQYAYLFRANLHEGFRADDFAQVRQDILGSAAMLKVPQDRLHICGDSSLWFVHPQGYSTCLITTQGTAIWTANLFLCFDGPLQANGLSSSDGPTCSTFRGLVPLREISSVRVRGHLLHIYGRQ